jgi:putative component of membrane protein insertase Oxa1/YidC/SpoIIIJ protein YidD
MRAIVVFLIILYQRYISPWKGFRCAHSVYHHGPSCSAAVRRIVEQEGVLRGLPLIRRRFAECRSAALALRDETEEQKRERRRRRREQCGPDYDCSDTCLPLDALDCVDCSGFDCAPDCSFSLFRVRRRAGSHSAQGS